MYTMRVPAAIVLGQLFTTTAVVLCTRGAAADEISGTLEIIEVIHHDRDPWAEYRLYAAEWSIDEYEHWIERLNQQRFTDDDQREKRDEQVTRMRQGMTGLRKLLNGLENEADLGMTEIRGWDPSNPDGGILRGDGAVIIECRGSMRDHVRSWAVGDIIEYIVEPATLKWDAPLANFQADRWHVLETKALQRTRRPDDWQGRDPTRPLSFETVDITQDADVEVALVERRKSEEGHAFTVIEAKLKGRSNLTPEVRVIRLHVDLVDETTGQVEQRLTDEPLALIGQSWRGSGIGWGVNDSEQQFGMLRVPYPPPPDGKRYEFHIVEVRVAAR
jgi:hypothetical protein